MIIPFFVPPRKRLTTATAHIVDSGGDTRFAAQVSIDNVFGVEATRGNVDERHLLYAVLHAPRVPD